MNKSKLKEKYIQMNELIKMLKSAYRHTAINYGLHGIISCCVKQFINYNSLKFIEILFVEFSKEKKSTRILEILKISEKSNYRFKAK